MKAVDTNILVRFFERDDAGRTAAADAVLLGRDSFFVSSIVLCELGWVLRSVYKRRPDEVATVFRELLEVKTAVLDRDAVLNGLALLEGGADFSDGVVLREARREQCTAILTFDRNFARAGAPEVELLS